jgi:hypothetical protein
VLVWEKLSELGVESHIEGIGDLVIEVESLLVELQKTNSEFSVGADLFNLEHLSQLLVDAECKLGVYLDIFYFNWLLQLSGRS